jgi:hypothetical protein
MLQIVLWKWKGHNRAFEADHVNIVCAMLRRNLPNYPHRILCVTDDSSGIVECETATLWPDHNNLANGSGVHLPSCYRRLKLYDKTTQLELGIERGDRILSLDLDTLICGDIRHIVETPGLFVGWELRGTHHPKVFNGSLQMFDAQTLQEIWSEFDPATSLTAAAQAGFKGSDQAWLSHMLVHRPGTVGLKWPEVSSWPLQNRIQGILRRDNRIIFFHGSVKPWDEVATRTTPWVARYWRA